MSDTEVRHRERVQAAVDALCQATRELSSAFAAADEARARRALAQRTESLDFLQHAVSEAGPVSDALLAEIRVAEQEALEVGRTRLASIQSELEQVRSARRTGHRLSADSEPARFVSRRV